MFLRVSNFSKFIYNNFKLLPLSVKIILGISLILGTYIRLVNITNFGYYFDLIYTQYNWGKAGYEMGVFGFWKDYTGFFDYSYLSLILETFFYSIAKLFGGSQTAFVVVLKSFNWLVEVIFGLYIIKLVYKYSPEEIDSQAKRIKAFLLAALSYILPSLWFVSGVWGQNDTLIALISAFSLEIIFLQKLDSKWAERLHLPQSVKDYFSFLGDNFFWSGVLLSLAFWIKQQAILVVPVLVLISLTKKKWTDLVSLIVWALPFIGLMQVAHNAFLNGDWQTAYYLIVSVLILLFIILAWFINQTDAWQNIRRLGFGFLIFSLMIIIPCTILNYIRLGRTFFAVIGRDNIVSNGAATFWRLLDIDGDASKPLFIFHNQGYLTIGLVGAVIYILSMLMLYLSFQQVSIPEFKTFHLSRLLQRQLTFADSLIFMSISCSTYFLFFTKMHSRYLHFAIVFSLLSLAVIRFKTYFYKWLGFTILLHLAYFLNQMGVYNGQDNPSPAWIPDFFKLLNTQYWDYWKLSSVVTLISLICLYILSKQIFATGYKRQLDKN